MSISIREFKTWAGQNQNAAVSVVDGALADASNQIGVGDRMFRRGTVNSVRSAAMKEFTRALSTRYGATIARQAISQAGLTSKSELTGRKISAVVESAKKLRADMLRPVARQDLGLGGTTIAKSQFKNLSRDDKEFLRKFLRGRAVAVELLGEIPLSMPDYQDFHIRATALVERLRSLTAGIIPANVPTEDFTAEVNALIKAINDKDVQMRDILAGQPLGEANVREYRDIWHAISVRAMESLRGSAGGNAAAAAAIGRAIEHLRTNPQVRREFDRHAQMSREIIKNLAPFIVQLVKGELRQANVRRFRVSTADMVGRLNSGFRQVLNERPWQTISKTFSTSVGRRPVEITSTIAPAAQLGHSQEAPRGPIAECYPQGVNGYMCHTADATHAVNLAVSKLTVADPGGAPKLAFCGVRHSVHNAWEIRNAGERAAANASRAEEAVMAAFLAKYSVLENPPELPPPGQDGVVTVDLDMTSVALLTPDTTRHAFAKGSSMDERAMLVGQTDAWGAVERTGVTFRFNGREIRVRPHIVTFNVGVNEGAVKMSGIAPNRAGGWDLSDRMNARAFETLTREVMAFANDKTKDGNMRATALALFNQCRNVLVLKGERKDSHDAYKVAARLAVLSYIIGKVPCFNCKSGKDRTGEMDVECKFLAALIARGEKIPEPGAKLTEEQKGLFRAIALQGGNFELQKHNVGVAGFMSGSVASISERLGGKAYHAFHRGGADRVAK
ncbi:MAG: hypothetical protein IJG84_01415 [Kiritimatiellae bacterium]|nr:hypothetical protein [Kiritimatiellia bacterium]